MTVPDLTLWLMVFLRAGALLAVFPAFSTMNIPVQVRLALAVLLAVLVIPILPPAPTPASFWDLIGLMSLEVGVGLLLGFVSRMLFYAIDFAGGLIAAESGLVFTPNMDPFNQSQTQAPGLILYLMAMVLLFSLDLHHWILMGFQRSYATLPIGSASLREVLLIDVIRRAGSIFTVGVLISAPLIAISFIITLIFAVLGRAVTQMNVFSESFPVRALCGIAIFGLALNVMAQYILNALRRLPDDLLRTAQLLGMNP